MGRFVMDCIWEDSQPMAAVSLTLQSVDGQLPRIGRLSRPAISEDTASFSQAELSSTTVCAKPSRRCDFVHERKNSEGTTLPPQYEEVKYESEKLCSCKRFDSDH
jgi:hypothetical protein